MRPIDQHLKGFSAMGAEIQVENGFIYAAFPHRPPPRRPDLSDVVSVGATMNTLMAAALADGLTIIENAAKEPHIVDLANFLNSMGADIMGAGTDVIKVRGVEKLRGGFYSIIPDQIEAGTYMTAVAAAGGEVRINNVIPKHLDCITAKLVEMGVEIQEDGDALIVRRSGKLTSTNVKTMPYPGFPPIQLLRLPRCWCLAEGPASSTRVSGTTGTATPMNLCRMGANIQVNGKVAVIEGVHALTGAPVCACDLRAGAAMIVAGLAANGITEIDQVYHIERGYEGIVEKLAKLGADIHEEAIPEEDWRSGNSVG
ncbi:MAG: UDP-N-acetylglucosamine 1-carboxyvinyltransferase [Evtepia gabavorous]